MFAALEALVVFAGVRDISRSKKGARSTGTMGVLSPKECSFEEGKNLVRLRGAVRSFELVKWRRRWSVLRQGCLYQYADAKETRLLQVMPLGGAKVLDLGQDVTVQYEESRQCYICASAFTTFNRRHHCRNCHRSCCSSDASEYVPVPASGFFSPVRVCNNCSRLCVAYLEILPISFDVGGMQRGVFTLPLHDAPFTVGLKSRVQEMWLSFRTDPKRVNGFKRY